MAYDPNSFDQDAQMQNILRQKMQAYGGVNPMNFNPQSQGAMGFAPSRSMEMGGDAQGAMGNYNARLQALQASNGVGGDMGQQPMNQWGAGIDGQAMQPPPESVGPQLPQHMQMQQARMNAQRAMVNRGNMMQKPAMGAAPGIPQQPNMSGYKAESAPQDFMGMRNAAAGMGAAMGRTPPNLNPAAQSKPMGGMGRVAAGLGAAGSAMGQLNQARNKAKIATKKPGLTRTPAAKNKMGVQMQEPPTF